MVSIEPSFNMLNRHLNNDQEDFTLYPEPPQGVFSSAPMDMPMTTEPFAAFPRSAQEAFPASMAYDPSSLYAEAPGNYVYHGRSSPGNWGDDGEMRAPSSNLSTASAASSAVGSPQSNHGQLAPMPEWAGAQGLGVTPNIVGQNDYFPTSNEYSTFAPGMEEFAPPFDFNSSSKPPGFVGELSQVSTPRFSHAHKSSVSSVVPPRASVDTMTTTAATRASDTSVMESATALSSPVSTCSGSSLVSFVSPTSASYASPPLPSAGAGPNWDCSSPKTPRVSPFFSQSSGHFVPPLHSSCWFPLVYYLPQRTELGEESQQANDWGCHADPSLIHPDITRPVSISSYDAQFPNNTNYPGSPPLSHGGSSPRPLMRGGSQSPFLHNNNAYPFSPYQPPMDHNVRRPSLPFVSPNYSENTTYSGDESKEKARCPHPDCGKTFKDLKAHMLTHQNERPEKCPIQTCDYHIKGFARKYDKNRHTLTHYKGTMVCGFCPGSGSAAEKSFNRADVFKRHLTAVHGVEQTPPNSRKKTSSSIHSGKKLAGYPPDATGKCSTCTQTFSNAQDFYEHLDDCVLRIVQQEDPAEAVNAKRLAEVENDRDVMQTLEKNNLPLAADGAVPLGEDGEEDEEMGDDDDDDSKVSKVGPPTKKKGNPANGVQKSRGMTHSRGGVPLPVKKGRKNRRDYPSSWGFDKGQMTMKKRVLAVFEGPRRLAKDDMMLSTDHEVRIKLSDNKSYVTDLDVQTMKRAEGFHGATDEEKGPWISDDPTEEELRQMREMLETNKTAETSA